MGRRRRALRVPIVVLCTTVAAVAALGGVAWAAFTSTTSATQAFTTLQLGDPTGASASATTQTATGCTTVAISWTAAPSADAYRIEVRENGGSWSDLVTETADVTTFMDTATRTNAAVEYRVRARDAGSNWEGAAPATTGIVNCGFAPVTDLAAGNPCSNSTLTWSATPGATTWDVQRRVNGSAWTLLATNQATTGFTDTTVHAPGSLVEYQVRPGSATADGAWSTSASIGSWQPFRVMSIVAANSGTLGTLNSGDTIVVTFSKPVVPGSVGPASMRVDNSGGNRGLYLAATSNATTGIGRVSTAASTFGASAAYSGTTTWGTGDTVYTWRSSVTGTTMTAPLANDAFTAGTGPKCAADGVSTLNGAYQPTSSGRW